MLEKNRRECPEKHALSKPLAAITYNKMPAASMKGNFFISNDRENAILKRSGGEAFPFCCRFL